MKIAIIGTHSYESKMLEYAESLRGEGHSVRLPAFDKHPKFDELAICQYNLTSIKWAGRVDIFWDCRSMGTIFDFGMVFALNKPIKIVYLETKTFMNVMKLYEDQFLGG